jgi:glycine/D-amino acid oxidase-like deaminating enzyme
VRDVELVDVQEILRSIEPVECRVTELRREGRLWLLTGSNGEEWSARNVLLCAGIWTDKLLTASGLSPVGVRAVRGRALLVNPLSFRRDFVFSWTTRPYTTFAMRPLPGSGLWRFGDSVERSTSSKSYAELRAAVDEHVQKGIQISGLVDGFRPFTPQAHTELVAPGLVASTGAYRNGLALAGIAAERSMELLGIG